MLVEDYPIYWEGIPPKNIELGIKFEHVHLGWTCQDYIYKAVKEGGFETLLDWGVQGSGKSNRILQQGYWVYGDWDLVLKNLVFKPKEFVKKLRNIPKGERVPWVGWDDIGVHYPSMTWRTDAAQYQAVDACWAAIRTKCNVISTSIPLIDRLAKNVKDNLTIEEYLGRNQAILIERLAHLASYYTMESYFQKFQIEPIHIFDIYDVPKDVFKEYWEMRLTLTEEALAKLDNTLTKDELDTTEYISLLKASQELHYISLATLTNLTTRGALKGCKIDGTIHIKMDDFAILKEQDMAKHFRRQEHLNKKREKTHTPLIPIN